MGEGRSLTDGGVTASAARRRRSRRPSVGGAWKERDRPGRSVMHAGPQTALGPARRSARARSAANRSRPSSYSWCLWSAWWPSLGRGPRSRRGAVNDERSTSAQRRGRAFGCCYRSWRAGARRACLTLGVAARAWPSALGDRWYAELTADRSRHAHANLAVARHERLRSRVGVLPGLVSATTSAGHGLGSKGAQPALQLDALHRTVRRRRR